METQLTRWKLIYCTYIVFVTWINHFYILLRVSTHFMDARLWDRCGALWLSSEAWAHSSANIDPSLSSQLFRLRPKASTFWSIRLQVETTERLWYNDNDLLFYHGHIPHILLSVLKSDIRHMRRTILTVNMSLSLSYIGSIRKMEMLRGNHYQRLLNMYCG